MKFYMALFLTFLSLLLVGAAEAHRPQPKLRMVPQWLCIHHYEGAWNSNTGNGYYGGLQMDTTFMRTYGRDMIRLHHGSYANRWTPREQIIVAQRAYDSGRGFYPWPNTARYCGLI